MSKSKSQDLLRAQYLRLSRCYIKLVQQFTQLDGDYLRLKNNFAEVLRLLKISQTATHQAHHERDQLARQLAYFEAKYQRLRRFEPLLDEIEATADSVRLP